MEIGRWQDHLISTMGFPLLVRPHLYIELGLSCLLLSTFDLISLLNIVKIYEQNTIKLNMSLPMVDGNFKLV